MSQFCTISTPLDSFIPKRTFNAIIQGSVIMSELDGVVGGYSVMTDVTMLKNVLQKCYPPYKKWLPSTISTFFLLP